MRLTVPAALDCFTGAGSGHAAEPEAQVPGSFFAAASARTSTAAGSITCDYHMSPLGPIATCWGSSSSNSGGHSGGSGSGGFCLSGLLAKELPPGSLERILLRQARQQQQQQQLEGVVQGKADRLTVRSRAKDKAGRSSRGRRAAAEPGATEAEKQVEEVEGDEALSAQDVLYEVQRVAAEPLVTSDPTAADDDVGSAELRVTPCRRRQDAATMAGQGSSVRGTMLAAAAQLAAAQQAAVVAEQQEQQGISNADHPLLAGRISGPMAQIGFRAGLSTASGLSGLASGPLSGLHALAKTVLAETGTACSYEEADPADPEAAGSCHGPPGYSAISMRRPQPLDAGPRHIIQAPSRTSPPRVPAREKRDVYGSARTAGVQYVDVLVPRSVPAVFLNISIHLILKQQQPLSLALS
jgi:hypothetical protein